MLSAIPRAIAALALLAVLLAAPAAAQEAPKPQIYNSSSKYIYQGCYNETLNMPNTAHVRAIADGNITTSKTNMTITACLSYCNNNNFKYAGIEYGEECYCGDRLSALSVQLPASSCNVACPGDPNFICGGGWALSVYIKAAGASSLATAGTSTLLLLVGAFSFYQLI